MADYGLWFVDKAGIDDRGVIAKAEVTTPTSYTCQASTTRMVPGTEIHVPSIVWYAFIGMKKSKTPDLKNFEAGIYLDTDKKVYLFHLGENITGQTAGGWDAKLISSTPLYGQKINITIDVTNTGYFKTTAAWSGKEVTLQSAWKTGVKGYNNGCVFTKEMTLGTNSAICLNNLWKSPYTGNDRFAKIVDFKMGPVTVYSSNNQLLETINASDNFHGSQYVSCTLPKRPTITTSNGTNTVSYDLTTP